MQTFYDEKKANNYKYNEASFNPTDDLVLNDGNLWDVRSGKMIYKFDKFNQYTSGCFHPRGLEVVINSEIVSFWSDISVYKSSDLTNTPV